MGRMTVWLFKRWVSVAVGLGWSPGEFTGDGEVVAMKEEPWQARMSETMQSGVRSTAHV